MREPGELPDLTPGELPDLAPEVLAARAEVRAARGAMESEIERLEAAARASLDIKTRVRRNPGRVLGTAAGIGFLAVGGPRRVVHGARRVIFGRPEPLPKALLPDEIERAVRALGDDGEKVRGALERNFARYLEDRPPEPRGRDLRSQLLFLGLPTARVLILRYGRQLLDEILSTQGGFDEQLSRVRARRSTGASGGGRTGSEPPAAG